MKPTSWKGASCALQSLEGHAAAGVWGIHTNSSAAVQNGLLRRTFGAQRARHVALHDCQIQVRVGRQRLQHHQRRGSSALASMCESTSRT